MIVATFKLKTTKAVEQGSPISLMGLFNSSERFRFFRLQQGLQENDQVSVDLGGAGSLTLAVGNDMAAEQQKTLMTLFWYPERMQSTPALRALQQGEELSIAISRAN